MAATQEVRGVCMRQFVLTTEMEFCSTSGDRAWIAGSERTCENCWQGRSCISVRIPIRFLQSFRAFSLRLPMILRKTGGRQTGVSLNPEKSDCPTKVSPFHLPWYAVSCVLLVGILIGVSLAWTFVSGRPSVSESSDNVPFKVETENGLAAKDSCEEKSAFVPKADSVQIQAVISAPSQHENVKVSAQSSSVPRREGLADTVEYDIVGTQTVHTLRSGESLARIALKFYGNKRLWPYIVKHNSRIIRNPDNIPVGTKIRIPILSPRK